MNGFHHHITDNCWLIGDRRQDGSWDVRVVDAKRESVAQGAEYVKAVLHTLDDVSALRAALWALLPTEVQASVLEERRGK